MEWTSNSNLWKSFSKQLKPWEFKWKSDYISPIIPEKNRVKDWVEWIISDPTILEKESFWKDQ